MRTRDGVTGVGELSSPPTVLTRFVRTTKIATVTEDGEPANAHVLSHANREKEIAMLWTIFVILLVLWLLGLVSAYTFGGFIHILLVLAIVILIFNLLSGRRTAV